MGKLMRRFNTNRLESLLKEIEDWRGYSVLKQGDKLKLEHILTPIDNDYYRDENEFLELKAGAVNSAKVIDDDYDTQFLRDKGPIGKAFFGELHDYADMSEYSDLLFKGLILSEQIDNKIDHIMNGIKIKTDNTNMRNDKLLS